MCGDGCDRREQPPLKLLGPHVRYELDAADHDEIARAIEAWRARATVRSCFRHYDCDAAEQTATEAGLTDIHHCHEPGCSPICEVQHRLLTG